MLKISDAYLMGKAEIPIHYTTWAPVEQALLICLNIEEEKAREVFCPQCDKICHIPTKF
jgi:hypothetical protein